MAVKFLWFNGRTLCTEYLLRYSGALVTDIQALFCAMESSFCDLVGSWSKKIVSKRPSSFDEHKELT